MKAEVVCYLSRSFHPQSPSTSEQPPEVIMRVAVLMFDWNFIPTVLLCFLSFHVLPSHQQTSFSFSNFAHNFERSENCSSLDQKNSTVCIQGNTSVSLDDGGIDLTTNVNPSIGRAVYPKPVRIWNDTGSRANFTTEFTFHIQKFSSKSQSAPSDGGDGFTFFLSPYSQLSDPLKPNAGLLGLMDSYVAVEFDTYQNQWDPSPSHVGIDVNSIVSKVTVSTNFNGTVVKAKVNYNAATSNLSVSLYYQDRPLLNGSILLSYIVNISELFTKNVVVGFAATSSKEWVQRHRILNWTFTSTPLEDNKDVSDKSIPKKSKSNTLVVAVGTSVGVGLLVISLCLVLGFLFFRKKSNNKKKAEGHDSDEEDDEEKMCDIDGELEDGTGQNPRRFPYKVLANATDDFNPEAKIGEGGFGSVYRGFLSDLNLEVAIKRVSRDSKQGKKEYVSEIKIISRLRHKNLVQLVGWCHRRSDLLLVYELMPKGSLDFHLFNKTSFLPWRLRYKIALELASGLLYLHEEWEQCVVHRDVKSSNVMLDSSFNAKLGDFGLARLSEHGIGLQTTFMAGTLGYMAPECFINGKASKEADVYSFGVVALEIACGRRSVDHSTTDDEQVRLVEWVWGMYGNGSLLEGLDKRFNEEEDVVDDEEARRLMVVGLWCAHPDINHRPSIRQAISVLNLEKLTPNLPPDMPLPTYSSKYEFFDGMSTVNSSNSTSTSVDIKKSTTVSLLIASSSKTLR